MDEAAAKLLELPEGSRWYALFPCGEHATTQALRDHLFELRKKGFTRLFQNGRVFEFSTPESLLDIDFKQPVLVLVDRLAMAPGMHQRLVDTIENCFREAGEILFQSAAGDRTLRFNERFECKTCGREFAMPEPILFSFNSPAGACPRCQGFGNTIDFDMDRVIPDRGLSLDEGAVEPWTKPKYRSWLGNFRKSGGRRVPCDVPFCDLTDAQREEVFAFIRRFFDYLETKKYKLHVRVFLSRYRGYALCPECKGSRLRQEALYVTVGGQQPGRRGSHEHRRSAAVLRWAGTESRGDRHRRQDPGGDPPAAEIPQRRRAGLPHAGPPVVHALRRRIAAHPVGHLPGVAAGGRVLRAGRAFHRAAPPRHRAADPDPSGTARDR